MEERWCHESHTEGMIVLKLHTEWALESIRWPHSQKIYILSALLNLIAKLVCIPLPLKDICQQVDCIQEE